MDVLSLAGQDTRLHKETMLEYSAPRPNRSCRCQTNGFRVRWKGTKWRFMCRGCYDSREQEGWGDEIDYLSHYRGMTYRQARAFLEGQETSSVVPPPEKPRIPPSVERMKACQVALWGADSRALDYARSRGITDETIKAAGMGYSNLYGIPRLLIPSMVDGQLVAVMRRDLRPDVPHNERWKDAAGSIKALYMADCLKRKMPTVLCEDAFSALSVWQEAKDICNVVSTCGADCCQDVQYVASLARMPLVLVALDADKEGEENARWWVKVLHNARRLCPWLKDINDMLRDGWDIRSWIADAINPPRPEPKLDFPDYAKSLVESCEMKVFTRGEYTLDMHVAMLAEQRRQEERAYDRAMWALARKKKAAVHSIEWSREQVELTNKHKRKHDPDAYRDEGETDV